MRPRAALFVPLISIAAAFAPASRAEEPPERDEPSVDLPPWREPTDLPLSNDAVSVEILRPDEPIAAEPSPSAKRRGAASKGARLPLYGARRAPGCEGRWLLVGANAWVCQDHVRVGKIPPLAVLAEPRLFDDGLPLRYHWVGAEGALGYRDLGLAEEGAPDAELQPGFAVALVQVAEKDSGDPFGLTAKGLWIPMRALAPVRHLDFQGTELGDAPLDSLGWIVAAEASLYASPGGPRISGKKAAHFARVTVLERVDHRSHAFLRIGEEQWVRAEDVRVASRVAAPPEARPGERWIDVDTASEILVAYEGDKPVFATLVSTGRGPEGSDLATPKGVHRIWVKLRTSDMTNLEDEEAERYYAIQNVPWVMYFEKGYGLHGAFWHRSFGHVRSHGCVNLTPPDAQRLFHWAGPRLPAGWSAVLPDEHDPGTIVQVR